MCVNLNSIPPLTVQSSMEEFKKKMDELNEAINRNPPTVITIGFSDLHLGGPSQWLGEWIEGENNNPLTVGEDSPAPEVVFTQPDRHIPTSLRGERLRRTVRSEMIGGGFVTGCPPILIPRPSDKEYQESLVERDNDFYNKVTEEINNLRAFVVENEIRDFNFSKFNVFNGGNCLLGQLFGWYLETKAIELTHKIFHSLEGHKISNYPNQFKHPTISYIEVLLTDLGSVSAGYNTEENGVPKITGDQRKVIEFIMGYRDELEINRNTLRNEPVLQNS